MKLLKLLGVLVTLVGVGILGLVFALSVYGPFDSPLLAQGRPHSLSQSGQVQSGQSQNGQTQSRQDERPGSRGRDLMMLAGRGSELGVRIAEGSTGGVVVEEVQPDSPAEKAGIKRSDIIVEFDGQPVESPEHLLDLLIGERVGRQTALRILRGGVAATLTVTVPNATGTVCTVSFSVVAADSTNDAAISDSYSAVSTATSG